MLKTDFHFHQKSKNSQKHPRRGKLGLNMSFSSNLYHILPYSDEKNRKIGKKFCAIFNSPGGTPAHPQISAQGQLIKNRLDSSKSSPLRTYHAKFGVSGLFRLGCRGGGSKMLLHILYSEKTCIFGKIFISERWLGFILFLLTTQFMNRIMFQSFPSLPSCPIEQAEYLHN